VIGADGAARGQGRPRLSRAAVGEFATRDRRRSRSGSTRPAGRSPSAARSSSARCCTTGWASRAGARARAGTYSTDVNELERLAARACRCARLVLDWRQLTKLKSTYTDALQAQINPETGRVHTSFSPVRRADRAAVLDRPQPAEHPDPHRDRPQDPRRLRRRAGACHAAERRLQPDRASARRAHGRRAAAQGSVRAGEDIHNLTAEELFGTVDRDTRNKAKTINFAILYGISRWGLAGRLGVSGRGAGDHRPLFRALPGHPRLHPRARSPSCASTASPPPCSAARRISPTSARPSRRSAAVRRARGDQRADPGHQRRPHQAGDGADGRPALAEPGSAHVRMLLQVHDELVFEVPDGREEEAAAVIREVMARAAEPALKLDVPLGRRGRLGRIGAPRIEPRRPPAPNRAPDADMPRWRGAGGSTSSASCCGSRRGCRSCSSPADLRRRRARPLRLCGADRRVRRAARDAGPQARARPAAARR
jgi:hypothetical protein